MSRQKPTQRNCACGRCNTTLAPREKRFACLCRYITTTKLRFLAKVEIRASGCWLWRGAINDKKSLFPYGVFSWCGRKQFAHRIAYFLWNGDLIAGLEVMHARTCESEACVNPDHLTQGTAQQNHSKEWNRRLYARSNDLAIQPDVFGKLAA